LFRCLELDRQLVCLHLDADDVVADEVSVITFFTGPGRQPEPGPTACVAQESLPCGTMVTRSRARLIAWVKVIACPSFGFQAGPFTASLS
jgi:hypothetical protein